MTTSAVYHVRTLQHVATGSAGLVVRLERGIVTEWTLADDYFANTPAWTSANTREVSLLVREAPLKRQVAGTGYWGETS